MSNYNNHRSINNNNNNNNSYLFQTQAPLSPVTTATNNAQQAIEEYDLPPVIVDYLVSPRPTNNRMNNTMENTAITNSSGNGSVNATTAVISHHGNSNSKRRSSSSTSSTTSSNSNSTTEIITLKSIKFNNDGKEHHLLRDPFQLNTASATAATNNNNAVLPAQNINNAGNTTTPSSSPTSLIITPKAPLHAIRYEKINKKSTQVHRRKEKLKEAKDEYEEQIEEYFHQLTVGCRQTDCRNRFCASGKGGIMSLQPQAALIMAIQLASMPGSRLCLTDSASETYTNTSTTTVATHEEKNELQQDHTQQQPQQQSVKPFLHSLFASTSLSGLLPKGDKEQQPQQPQKQQQPIQVIEGSKPTRSKSVIKKYNEAEVNQTSHWSTDIWKLFSHFGRNRNSSNNNSSSTILTKTNEQHYYKEYEHESRDDSYYQIDYEDHYHRNSLSCLSDCSSSIHSDNDMLLSITPIKVNLDLAVEYLHRAIVIKSISEEKMDIWCRSVFQSWEGIGNSFLSLVDDKQEIQLNELCRFFQLVIHQDGSIDSANRQKQDRNPRQIRIMESISDSFEILLDRMSLNVEALTDMETLTDESETQHSSRIVHEWCRSLMAVFQWIICCKEKKVKEEQEGLATLVAKLDDVSTNQKRIASIASTSQNILIQKLIQVLSKIAQKKKSLVRRTLQDSIAKLDSARLECIVQDLQQYLLDHFHTGPYKHGLQDTVIMTFKCLELLYQGNMNNPSSPIIPPSVFYSLDICKKLNIRHEHRIWKRVLLYGEGRHSMLITRQDETEHQRRSRLFMTTTSTSSPGASSSSLFPPYPFENEYQFSPFSYPFILPPSIKRKIILIDAMSQMSLEYEDACVNHTLVVHAQKLLSEAPKMIKSLETNLRSATCPYLLLEIRREHFINDSLTQLSKKWADLKKPLKIKFIEGGEEGMDQGGVQKEFFGVLFEKLVSPDLGLFTMDENTRLCWFHPVMENDDDAMIRMYEMVGVMMGLAVYNGVIMNLQFPQIVWKVLVMPTEALVSLMADRQQLFTLEDLEDGWPDLGKGLRQLLTWEDDVEDVFCRDYEISMDVFGQGVMDISLMQDKEQPMVPVTNENREQYVKDYCKYFMYTAQKKQILALRRGIWSVIGSRALNLCTAKELEMVACGQHQGPDALELNMVELETVTEYDDGYNLDHPTIRQFWSVVHNDLTNEQKKQLLLFVTASDRVPVGGLKELTFYIQRNGPDSDRLPTALTCFSRLLLPEYASRQKLRDRLVTAIENTKGFGLV